MNKRNLLWPLAVIALPALARVAIIESSVPVYEQPRSQIKTYIQSQTIDANLKPVKAVKPGALSDEELVAIPEKYLPPELKKKQDEVKKRIATEKKLGPKKAIGSPLLKESQVVKIKNSKNKVLNLRIDEAVWVPPTAAIDSSILAPQQKLPEVELLQETKVSTSGTVAKEIEPGETREVKELFQDGKTQDTAKKHLLDAYRYYGQKDYATSLTLAIDVLSDPKKSASDKLIARYLAAHSLYQAGFYASALPFLVELMDTKLRRSAVGIAAKCLEKTRDDGPANQILAKLSISQIPEEYQPLFSFHLGRILLNTGAREAALAAFRRVPADHKRNPEAEYFMGVIQTSELGTNISDADWQKDDSPAGVARAHFETALVSGRAKETPDLLNLIRLSMARLAYQAKQYNQAIFLYQSVEPTSPFSRESLYESSWALYRTGEYTRSLGTLHPLGSPYFEGRDMPELWILRSLNYLKTCRFDEARKAANTFEGVIKDLSPQLKGALSILEKSSFKKPSDLRQAAIPEWLKSVLLSDPVVQKDLTTEDLLTAESDRLDALKGNLRVQDQELRESAAVALKAQLSKKIQAVANALKPYLVNRVRDIDSEYNNQKQRLDFLRFEIYSQATKFPKALERPEANKLIAKGEFLPGVFLKGHEILWRFSGEYWLDEIKGYDYALPTECREDI
jgi:predicted negative regulator of RcsB-dependent stress response